MLPFICQIGQGALAAFAADIADAVCGRRAEPILHPGVTGRLGAGASLSAPPFTAQQVSLHKAGAAVLNDQELCSPSFSAGLCRVWTVSWPPQAWGAAGWASRCRQCPPPPPPPHGYLQRALAMGALRAQLQSHSRPTSTRQTQWRRKRRNAAEPAAALPLKAVTCSSTGNRQRFGLCPSVGGSRYTPATRHASSSSRRETTSTQTRDVQGSRVFPVE